MHDQRIIDEDERFGHAVRLSITTAKQEEIRRQAFLEVVGRVIVSTLPPSSM